MLHWLVVGHFDPLDPLDMSEKPFKPKAQRLISREATEQAVTEFGRDIEAYLSYDDGGFVYCNWSFARHELWDRVRDFAYFLAEREHAIIIDERWMVWWPPEASDRQMKMWNEAANSRNAHDSGK